jgi:drug/metabolite transporter (DMT)-like permease
MSGDNKPVLTDWLALMLLVMIWGSSFILIKKGLVSFNAMEVGALRITISFLVLVPFVVRRLGRVPRNKYPWFLLAGILGSGLPPFLFAKAQTVIDSYMAGVLNSLTPLFTLIAGLAFFGSKTRWQNVVGVVVGLAGAVGLLTAVNDPRLGNGILYGLYAVAGAVCYAFNMNTIKRYLSGFDALTITSVVFLFIGIPAAVYVFAGTDVLAKLTVDPASRVSLGYIAILAVVGTALSLVVHNWLIRRTSALFASSVTYMMPIVSIGWGIADGEGFTAGYLLWIVLILIGVYLANRPARRAVPPSPVP